MANLAGFDASKIEPASSFEAIPAGKYMANILDSVMKPTRNGNGHYLELTMEIVDGQYRGRRLWARLNLENPNAVAVQIAQGELSAICRAVGVMTPRDSSELHNRPLTIRVVCKKNEDTGEIQNEVKGYESRTAALPAPQVAATQAVAVAATGSPPPWLKKV
jgi:hypothetical protein